LIDLTGKKFFRLRVVERSQNNRFGQATWKCLCDCGKETVVDSHSLRRGNTKSCGCYGDECRANKAYKDKTRAYKNTLYKRYKKICAEERGYEFVLSFKEFISLIRKNCFFCGISPINKCGIFLYNGLDRLDNKKGYTRDNVVTCCRYCNIAKSNMAKEEFLDKIFKCYDHLNGLGCIQ